MIFSNKGDVITLFGSGRRRGLVDVFTAEGEKAVLDQPWHFTQKKVGGETNSLDCMGARTEEGLQIICREKTLSGA